jgi:hypothetical protein
VATATATARASSPTGAADPRIGGCGRGPHLPINPVVRITGFTDNGEVRIVDDEGRLAGYGELRLEDAHITGVDSGDRFALEIVVTWTPEPDDEPDLGDIDWDQLLR